MKIETKEGEIEFEEFELKDSNLRKANINYNGEDVEGLRVYFSDADIVSYDSDKRSGFVVGALANSPIMFYPKDFWGAYLPFKLNGDSRPVCNVANLCGKPQFHKSVE